VLALTAGLLIAVALLAGSLPAHKDASVDPMVALRIIEIKTAIQNKWDTEQLIVMPF
jgi:hypothetical protein